MSRAEDGDKENEILKCEICGFSNPNENKFCHNCGERLPVRRAKPEGTAGEADGDKEIQSFERHNDSNGHRNYGKCYLYNDKKQYPVNAGTAANKYGATITDVSAGIMRRKF